MTNKFTPWYFLDQIPEDEPEDESDTEPRAFIVDPIAQSITEAEYPKGRLEQLIEEVVGESAESFSLDQNCILWASDVNTNERFAFYFERMLYPFNVRRYSKALIVSMGPDFWSVETVREWLRFVTKE
jgi:hypothetical protein